MAGASVALNVAPVAKVREAEAAAAVAQQVGIEGLEGGESRKRWWSWEESGTEKWHFRISPRQVSVVVVRWAEAMVFSKRAASKRWLEKYSEVNSRILARLQLHTYLDPNFTTAAVVIRFCRSNTSKMWKIKFRMNFKNVVEITSVADVDLG